jgi:hypothetical protein
MTGEASSAEPVARWLPLALLALALGVALYLLSLEVDCRSGSRVESIAWGVPPVLLLAAPLIVVVFRASGFVRGAAPWLELAVLWVIAAGVYVAALANGLQCID